MSNISQTEMRRDLEHWQDERALWLQDVNHWQTEHQSALAEMERLETFVKASGGAVREHAESIAAYERTLVEHARLLAEAPGATDRYEELLKSHQQLAAGRTQHRDAHGRIRAHHLVVMAYLRTLVKAMSEAM
jgi:hypothetical protein